MTGYPKPCDPCFRGDHDDCWNITSQHPDDRCGCYQADLDDVIAAPPHDVKIAWQRASDGA